MAEFSARRVVALAAVAGALVGGAVAGGVAASSSGGSHDSPASSPSGSSSVTTTAVVRTTLSTTVQVGGSIGYQDSYSVAAPSGFSAQQVNQDQQTVTKDQQTLAADEQAESDAASGDGQAISAAQTSVASDQTTLGSDQAKEAQDCAVPPTTTTSTTTTTTTTSGQGASPTPSTTSSASPTGPGSSACDQDGQKVSQDQSQLTQAEQQVASARLAATRDHDQDRAKVTADQTTLQGDQATLASAEATAVNPGTAYTGLPSVGQVITQDQAVYSVSNVPVPLLYGSITAYRAFYVGMSDGADVGQLTHDVIALGYGAGLAQSDHYSSATATAVERWQTALGLPATGQVLLGEVVFEPGPIRVTSVTPSVGAALGGGGGGGGGGAGSSGGGGGGGGTVLTATSTTPVVTVALDVTQEYLVKPGDAVSVVLPDGTSTVGGHVETVGNVAVCPGGGGTGTGSGSSGSADQSPCSSSGSGSSSGGSGSTSTPTVTVTISLDATPPGATLDQAPVNVNITTQRVKDVLAVPVNALLALQGGGFGVDVVSGTTTRLVGVTTGLYSNTLVQIAGSGVTAGTRVEVPSS